MHAHFLDDRSPIDAAALRAEGIPYEALPTDPAEHQAPLAALMEARGYLEQDQIRLSPETPNLEALCQKFLAEHHHDDDEVRFVLEGEGIFDIRSREDRWMRITVEPGDLIIVPAMRHHRFLLTDRQTIRCVRLFQDQRGWVPHYREALAGSAE